MCSLEMLVQMDLAFSPTLVDEAVLIMSQQDTALSLKQGSLSDDFSDDNNSIREAACTPWISIDCLKLPRY